jgi:hypothetical protein
VRARSHCAAPSGRSPRTGSRPSHELHSP